MCARRDAQAKRVAGKDLFRSRNSAGGLCAGSLCSHLVYTAAISNLNDPFRQKFSQRRTLMAPQIC
jgi:hypothetical protein